MIGSYVNYGIYNDDTLQCLEEGDDIDSFTYWDNGRKVTLVDVHIAEITGDDVTCELEDSEKIIVPIETIDEWE